MRELKKTKGKKSGDAGTLIVSCWPLFEIMRFVGDTEVSYINQSINK